MRFRPDEHIRRRAEFQQVYERGARIRGRFSTLFLLPNKLSIGRLGDRRHDESWGGRSSETELND